MVGGCGESVCLACVPGNDLGRVLRWGAGYSGEDPFFVLLSVDEADTVLMDRWTILLDAHQASGADGVANVEPPKVQRASEGVALDVRFFITSVQGLVLAQPDPGSGASPMPFTDKEAEARSSDLLGDTPRVGWLSALPAPHATHCMPRMWEVTEQGSHGIAAALTKWWTWAQAEEAGLA